MQMSLGKTPRQVAVRLTSLSFQLHALLHILVRLFCVQVPKLSHRLTLQVTLHAACWLQVASLAECIASDLCTKQIGCDTYSCD